jgi:hypothetical protein
VTYPHVMVQRAQFLPLQTGHESSTSHCPTGSLGFTLVPGDNAPTSSHPVTVDCSACNLEGGIDTSNIRVTVNRHAYTNWSYDAASGRLIIVAPGWEDADAVVHAEDHDEASPSYDELRIEVIFGSDV